MRTAPFLVLALLVAHAGGTAAQPPKGAARTPLQTYEQFRATMQEGKYDIAGLFLDEFLKAVPDAAELGKAEEKAGTAVFLEIERKYGTTVFQSLRAVPKFSDDPATEKKIRDSVEDLNRRAQAVAAKLLYRPERVQKYITNLAGTYEERVFAQQELKRTGEYAVPFLVDAIRTNPGPELYSGILETIPVLEGPTMAGWVAALDTLPADRQFGILTQFSKRRDVLNLLTAAQTDFTPHLWRILSRPRAEAPTLYDLAGQLHNLLVPGAKADAKNPVAELTAAARKFYDHKARYLGARANPDGTPAQVPLWVATAADGVVKLNRLPDVPVPQAEEYFGLRYARWALEAKPDYEPAQSLMLSLAAERAAQRAQFGSLAAAEPAVYRLLADAPSQVLNDMLARGLAEKRTALAFAALQALGDRADRAAATPPAGPVKRPSLLVRALTYPDHAVQFAAAAALLRSPVPVPADAKTQIVEILRRAAGTDMGKPGESKGTVLLVDPAPFRADATAAVLGGFGYTVEILATGRDLLRRTARASDFDLIFIDRHAAPPELIDLIGQVVGDPRTAGRPVYVIASPDKPRVPTFDQLVLRLALLVAATEADPVVVPRVFVPDPRATPEQLAQDRAEAQSRRDDAFLGFPRPGRPRKAGDASPARPGLIAARAERLQRVLDTLPLTLNADQKRLLELRAQLISYAVIAAEFPFTAESAPFTAGAVEELRRQARLQPPGAAYQVPIAVADLMKLIERFELDVAKVPEAQKKYDLLRSRVDAAELGLAVETFRDAAAEARLARLLKGYPEVRVIPEPYTRLTLEPEFQVLFADPAMQPRGAALKKADARAAVEYLRQMAVGDLPGYQFQLADAELRGLVTNPADPDLAAVAVEAVERIRSGDAQMALLQLATRRIGEVPVALRRKAADAAIRHIRANGAAAPPALVTAVVTESTPEATPDPELRAKLLTLKGMLAFKPGEFAGELRGYSPPIVPVPKKEPEKKDPQ